MKKFLPIFLVCIVLGNLFLVKPKPANAMVAPIAGALAEKVFIGITEKAGVKYTTEKAAEKAMKRWNMEMYNDLAMQTNLNGVNDAIQKAEIIPFPESDSRSGKFGKVLIKGALFVTGADIAIDIYQNITKAQAEKTALELFETTDIPAGQYTSLRGFKLVPHMYYSDRVDYYDLTNGDLKKQIGTNTPSMPGPATVSYEEFERNGVPYVSIYGNAIPFYWPERGMEPLTGTIDMPKITWDSYKEKAPTTTSETPIGWSDLEAGPVGTFMNDYRTADEAGKEQIIKEVEHAYPDGVEIVVPLDETGTSVDPNWNDEPYNWNDPLPETVPAEPVTNPDTGTNPDPDTGTNPNPDTGTNPNPDTGTNPDPDTGTNPNPDTGTNPDPDTGTNPDDPTGGDGDETSGDDPTKKKLDLTPLLIALGNIKDKFPFSIPWDFERLLSQFNVEPKTPKFEIRSDKDIKLSGFTIPVNYNFDVSFDIFDGLAKIARWGLIIAFDIFLIFSLRRMTPD